MRAVFELAGIQDILSKSLGSQNPINLVKATVGGLRSLRTPDEVAEIRGLTVAEVLGLKDGPAPSAAAACIFSARTPASALARPQRDRRLFVRRRVC